MDFFLLRETPKRVTFTLNKSVNDFRKDMTFDGNEYVCNLGHITPRHYPKMKDVGCYIFLIEAQTSTPHTTQQQITQSTQQQITHSNTISISSAVVCLSKGDKCFEGDVKSIVSSAGVNGEKICVNWKPFEYPRLVLNMSSFKFPIQSSIEIKVNVSIFGAS